METDAIDLGYEHKYADLKAWDKCYLWHPFTHLEAWLSPENEIPLITGADGPWLLDHTGRRVIDGNSSIWCSIHGHRHRHIMRALASQAGRFSHVSFLGYSHPPGILLAKRLIEDHLGKWGFARVFFSESGSNAIEAAIRMALQWQAMSGNHGRKRIIAFESSYHGDSLGSASVSGLDVFRKFIPAAGYDVIRLKSHLELPSLDPENIAALIHEPMIAGAAGMRLWPKGMAAVCRDWCDANDVLIIHDEVFTGFGRTGEMFAFEHERVPADILVLGKGLSGGAGPLSATVVNHRVFETFASTHDIADAFLYGHSYSAHAPGCAAGIASLDVFRDEDVLNRTRSLIPTFTNLLNRLASDENVLDVRHLGLIGCVEVKSHDAVDRDYASNHGRMVVTECWQQGLATRAIGNAIVLILPLCADEALIRRAIAILHNSIQTVFNRLKKSQPTSNFTPLRPPFDTPIDEI